MGDEYPSEANLARIKYLASNMNKKNILNLLALLENLWRQPEDGFIREEAEEGITLKLLDFAWSGNEAIIEALVSADPDSFYQKFWQLDKPGYLEFFIPKEAMK